MLCLGFRAWHEQDLQKKLRKGSGAAAALDKKTARLEQRQAEKDSKLVSSLCTKVHRALTPLIDSMGRLDKKLAKNCNGVDETQIQIFKAANDRGVAHTDQSCPGQDQQRGIGKAR